MTRRDPADEWGDLDSDDIASIASDELHAHRPNRWTGAPSTWRNLTKDERMLWQSLERLRNEDLGVHLYNAFALKRQATEPEGREFLTVKSDDGKQSIWQPPKAWTAWPLKPNQLPLASFLKTPSDQYDDLTFSQPSNPMPSTDLHDELYAHILRFAKDRFRRRMAAQEKRQKNGGSAGPIFASIEGPNSETAPSSPDSELSYRSVREEKRGLSEMDVDEEEDRDEVEDGKSSKGHVDSAGQRKRKRSKPQVSADDGYSEELLRASVRHILSQLDKTLMILHYARVATASHLEEASDYDDMDLQSEPGERTPRSSRRRRGRSRSQSRPRSRSTTPAPTAPTSRPPTPGTTSGRPRGRPRKVHTPLEGETPEEMDLRIARQSHRAKPTTVAKRSDAAFEAWLQKGEADEHDQTREDAATAHNYDADVAPTEVTASAPAVVATAGKPAVEERGKSWREQKLDRLGLRDWSDVLGAAALAGFSEEVVDRATKRCAKLFNQGMVMRRLAEVPIKEEEGHGEGILEVVYRPEEVHLEDTDVEDHDENIIFPVKARSTSSAPASRLHSLSRRSSSLGHRSLPPTRSPTPSSSSKPRFAFPSTTATSTTAPPPILSTAATCSPRSRSGSLSRSRSRSATADMYCPEPTCPRHAKGFDRRANLERHVRLVHGGRKLEDWEVDSDEEVVGGVRVDGFLKEIVPETGWFRKKRVRSRQVVRREGNDNDDSDDAGYESE